MAANLFDLDRGVSPRILRRSLALTNYQRSTHTNYLIKFLKSVPGISPGKVGQLY